MFASPNKFIPNKLSLSDRQDGGMGFVSLTQLHYSYRYASVLMYPFTHTPAGTCCQDWNSSTILLGGPGVQGTNEEVSPDTSRC